MRFRRFISVAGVIPVLVLAGSTAQAQTATNAGGGSITGSVGFFYGGVPVASTQCMPAAWSFSGAADGVFLDIASNEAAGAASVLASGSSSCTVAGAESGTASVSITQTSGIGNFSCGVSGLYTRVLSHVHLDLRGSCVINRVTVPAEFVAEGEFVATSTGGPVTNPVIVGATFGGSFVVAPPF